MIKPQDPLHSPAQAGFNLIEMMFVLAIMGVLSGMAVIQINVSRPGAVGDGAMRVVLGQLNQARELAITQRRYICALFTAPNLVQIVREDTTGASCLAQSSTTTTTISSVLLEGSMQFALVTGVSDTPDGFGKSATGQTDGIAFIAGVKFSPDGTLVDKDGATKNGSLFLALPNQALSARAVTVLGSTGRVRGFRWDGKQWTVV